VVDVSSTPRRLERLRRQLLRRRGDAPFFDLERLARAQERLADGMWRVQVATGFQGGPPMHVIVAR